MAYSEKIQAARVKAYSHSVAIKILDLMKNLRLSANENARRRWVWELLQNAKDVPNESGRISVAINLDKSKKVLEFSHDGKPFTTENITFLIEQVSTKERANDRGVSTKPTGKFGTGFLTTHLLSKIVTINGFLKEPNEPYKRFTLTLDRSGRDVNSIIESVEKSISELSCIDESPESRNYSPNELNTIFAYNLDEGGILVAERGIKDLCEYVLYSIVFLPEIKTVQVTNLGIKFEKLNDYKILSDNIFLYTINEVVNSRKIEHRIIKLSKDNVTIAIQVEITNNRIYLKNIKPGTPKLFCDFPLIGTEDFPFPVIVNSSDFNPTEPRDGVHLTAIEDEEIAENKAIMSTAVFLYFELIDYASMNNWGNMYLFASSVTSVINVDWLSNKWLSNEITSDIKEKIYYTDIVDTQLGERKSIKDENGEFSIYIPTHREQDIRAKIWELCKYWIPGMLPPKQDVDCWYSVLWHECKNLNLEVITFSIQQYKNLENIQENLSEINAIVWLNTYYRLLNDESNFIDNIVGDKYAIIPNQNGILKKRTELKLDKGIDEELKNALLILGEDCKNYLLHKEIYTGDKITYYPIEQRKIISEINERLSGTLNENILNACFYLVTLFSDDEDFPLIREKIYNFCSNVFPLNVNAKRKLINWSENIWDNVDDIILRNLVVEISKTNNVGNLTELLVFIFNHETIEWLNSLITFLNENGYEYLLNDSDIAIFPNQNGNFIIKDDIFLDDGSIDESLKNICSELGHDIREELLDTNIFLELNTSRTKTQKDIAEDISNLVRAKLREQSIDYETQKAFNKLLIWFKENKEIAKDIFSDLYKNKHNLYDDTVIAENMDKAGKYDELLDKYNIKDYSSLDRLLQSATNNHTFTKYDKQEISEDVLAQMGIYSNEELENAFRNEEFAEHFAHISSKDVLKFDFVQSIIKRSIDNVFRFLKSKPEYNLETREEIAKTIFSITKNNEDIYIIIRPSDYDQIIIYYDSEKDLLDYEKDCELWVDNGNSPPQKITFGKILKITGINRIPLVRVI